MISNNILNRAFKDGAYVSPMKLQKILYFVASEYQKKTGRPLLSEPFQTWAYGPVVSSVYDEFRPFSKQSIRKFAKDAKGDALVINEDEDFALKDALNEVWERTKYSTAVQLSRITHSEDSGWDRAFQKGAPFLDTKDIGQDNTYRQPLRFEAPRTGP